MKYILLTTILPTICFGYSGLNRWGCRDEGNTYQCYEDKDLTKPIGGNVDLKKLQGERELLKKKGISYGLTDKDQQLKIDKSTMKNKYIPRKIQKRISLCLPRQR